MGGDVTIKVEGLRELERALVEIAEVGAPRVLAKALKTPMEKVFGDAKAMVPKRTGELHDALDLVVKRASASRASMAETLSEVGLRIKKTRGRKAGTRGGEKVNPRRYWHLVEFGTSRVAPHPFIRPAFDQNTQGMLEEFKGTMRTEIERVRARVARRRK